MQLISKRSNAKNFQKLARMMDQQFWRWGCDVKHGSGNLLAAYGFKRIPPSNQEPTTSSAYHLNISTESRLVLRSFAVFYGDDGLGGILLKRFDGDPYRTPSPDLESLPYHEPDLPPLRKVAPDDAADDATSSALLADLIQQIIAYEAWVRTAFGNDYVQETLEKRHKRPVVSAKDTEANWEMIAHQFREAT